MEDFFEAESVMYLGRIDEDNVFWDDLLMGNDAVDAGQRIRLLEVENRDCEEELKWFDSLLIEGETEKDNSTREFAEMLEEEAQTTVTEKDAKDSKEGDIEVPKVEMKELPSHLKYVFLGENNTFPVIIAAGLEKMQEEELVSMLSQKKKVIGWGIHDIVGISPTMCMHRIELNS